MDGAGYTLACALTLITGDRFGHRALFVVGTAGFGASSLLAGCAPNVTMLLAARIAQGLSAGLMVPQVLSFIHVESRRRSRARPWGSSE